MNSKGLHISKLHILTVITAIVFGSCVKPKEFPVEPYLEFRRNIVTYEVGASGDTVYNLQVEFYFQDGDGDIGRKGRDSVFPYVGDSFANLHFQLYSVEADSIRREVCLRDSAGRLIPIKYPYRLNYVEPVNANGAMSGLIRWDVDDFNHTVHMPQIRGKAVCYSIYLYDRALHKSNVIYTDPIKL